MSCFETTSAGRILQGIFALLVAIGFAFAAFADIFMISKVSLSGIISSTTVALFRRQVHRLYRSSGASLSKAQAEFATGIFGNEHVRQAAADAATASIRANMSNSSRF